MEPLPLCLNHQKNIQNNPVKLRHLWSWVKSVLRLNLRLLLLLLHVLSFLYSEIFVCRFHLLPFSVHVYSFLVLSDSFLIGLSGANRVFSEIAQKIVYAFKILQNDRTQSAKTKTGLDLKTSRYQRQKLEIRSFLQT